MSFCEKPDFN